jgi:homoserine O-acetyltransferase
MTASQTTLSEAAVDGTPQGHHLELGRDEPLVLDSGQRLGPFTIAYQTYGRLNAARSNAVLVCHALTGDQFVIGQNPITGRDGWWPLMVGPGLPIDTERYFVICANVLGGCMGTIGPKEVDPRTERPYALSFPFITIADMVRAQAMLLDALGIADLFCVIGGSMGGMQVLQWAASYPKRVFTAVPIACAAHHSAQNIALHEVGRQAIFADPDWRAGNYLLEGTKPRRGLAVARMAAHITYLSEKALQEKFGRRLQKREQLIYDLEDLFAVESYLRHQGENFVERFDANSYIYITRAMDYFDLAARHDGRLGDVFQGSETRFLVISFTGDWLYPTSENRQIVRALNAVAANVSFVEVASDKGHDAFLLDEPVMFEALRGFLQGAGKRRGLIA